MDGVLSQEEINALLSEPDGGAASSEETLTDSEKDAIGEIANISMGTAATTLFSLVNRKVEISTPVVSFATWDEIAEKYERPCVFIRIAYTVGLDGSNILVLKERDVKVITDLMMGGDGENVDDSELGELHLSAISEAMNQMMGSSATSLSSMLGTMIDISPPESSLINISDFQNPEDISAFLSGTFVKIAFSMQIEDLVDSTIMQLYPIEFAKTLYSTFMGMADGTPAPEPEPPAPEPIPEPAPAPQPAADYGAMPQMDMSQMGMPQMGMPQMGMPMMGMPQMDMSQMGMPMMGMPQMGMPQMGMPMMGMPQQNVNIQPAQFQNFAPDYSSIPGAENIGLIRDVPLEVTVELGRTQKKISDILDFAPGTIIELDKIAGEPVDVLVNGKLVAKGEVVVIEESFGVRVTDIIKD